MTIKKINKKCEGFYHRLCENNDCSICFNKSFASHPRSKNWSAKNNISPRDVTKFSNKEYMFDCECGHSFGKLIFNITKHNTWCPYCSNPPIKLCEDISCVNCYNKSFASHPYAEFWSDQNNTSARNVFKSSNIYRKFDCNVCLHTFESSPGLITNSKRWCPYCNKKILCNNEKCKFCFDASFASIPKAKYWASENEDSPREVFKGSDKIRVFDCPDCNEQFSSKIYDIYRGHWCSCKKYKTQTKLYDYLSSILNCKIVKEKKFDWCKKNRHLPFDFFIKKYNLIIELDGIQHFKQVSNWQSPFECQKNDAYKMECANKHGYTVIRILQNDVWKDKNNWKQILLDHIKRYKKPTNLFMNLTLWQITELSLSYQYLKLFLGFKNTKN